MRNVYIDNVKGVLITLVVIGHLIEPLLGKSAAATQLYWFLYLFHMPLFVAISGYCSRVNLPSDERRKLFIQLLLPYIVLQIIYTLVDSFLFDAVWHPKFATPYYILWYIFALLVWRLLMPYWMLLRWPLASAIIVGLLAGLVNGDGLYFSLSRIFVFLPFFIAGVSIHQKKFKLDFAFSIRHRLLAVFTICSIGALSFWGVHKGYAVQMLYGIYDFKSLGLLWYEGVALRSASYILATITSLALLAIVPKRKTLFEWIGRYSLYPFIQHGFIVKIAIASGAYALLSNELQVSAIILGAIGLTIALSTKPVRLATDFILSGAGLFPKLVSLTKKKSTSATVN